MIPLFRTILTDWSRFSQTRARRGAALIVVLSMIALLAILILAFFSRTLLEHQISNSSSNQVKVDLFAQGAVDQIVGDLKQEIVNGSNPVSGTNPSIEVKSGTTVIATLYRPKTIKQTVPQLAVPNGAVAHTPASIMGTGLENLIKVSKHEIEFAPTITPAIPSRAIADSTANASLNSRSISTAGWNKSLLLKKATPGGGDITPVATFTSPDWILVSRDGSNPLLWNNNLRWANTPTAVVGRYAYAVYNEGGLLDANAAGYPALAKSSNPSGLTKITDQTLHKDSQSYADLTQIGLTAAQVDEMVKWRNQATIAAGGGAASLGYFNFASQNKSRFMANSNTALSSLSSDRMFVSRQQLLDFFLNQMTGTKADLQNALLYLGTFSRSLEQPSFMPDVNRAKVAGPMCATAGDYTGGGNSAHTSDDSYNPVLRNIRVAGTDATKVKFTRNDGVTPAYETEPLLKKRFALNRLAWLTCNGPIANDAGTLNPSSDPIIGQVIAQLNASGLSNEFLARGGPANIKKYFGLTWTSGSTYNGTPIKYWVYDHGMNSGGQVYVGLLSDVAAGNREPDFFELLKATIHVGSVAKAYEGTGVPSGSLGASIGNPAVFYPPIRDSRVDMHILQLGANIIDCANPTQFPTQIQVNDGPISGWKIFYGSQDLPYFNSRTDVAFIVTPSSSTVPPGPPKAPAAALTTANQGQGAMLCVPSVWNPYEVSGAAVPANLAPTNLRINVVSAPLYNPTLDPTSNSMIYFLKSVFAAQTSYLSSGGLSPEGVAYRSDWKNAATTSLYFSNPNPTLRSSLYREPTALLQPNLPAGSNLHIEVGNSIASAWSVLGVPETGSGQSFIGFLIGTFPLQWNKTDPSGTPTLTTYTTNQIVSTGNNFGSTMRLEYQSGGNWIPYQEIVFAGINAGYVPLKEDGSATTPYVITPAASSLWNVGVDTKGNGTKSRWGTATLYDPRSNRFGLWTDFWSAPFLETSGTPSLDTLQTIWPSGPAPINGPGGSGHTIPVVAGWTGVGGTFYHGQISQNLTGYSNYKDADGVLRKGMAGYVPGAPASLVGIPMATVYAPTGVNAAFKVNRPVMLHRPYRSVAELGYVFRDTAWKNIDFFTPESGDAALLDVFCISENSNADGITAGKVDLNTRQYPVLQAILAGAYKDETAPATGAVSSLEAGKLAGKLVARTSGGTVNGQAPSPSGALPLKNISELVGSLVGASYEGFSADVSAGFTAVEDQRVQRFRESAMRALSAAGQAGTWNLMIDVIAQVGRYPGNASTASNFMVEGERRYWLHLAIDRQTGQILDQKIEIVNE